MVKHEMLRINIGIVGISEFKWTGMSEFNSDDHYIYYCGQESQRRNGVALIINKTVQNAVLGFNLKNDRMILISFQGKPFSITVIQVYPPTTDAEEPPYNPAIPLLAYPQTKLLFKKIYAPLCSSSSVMVFTAALFTIAKTYKQPKQSTNEWIKKLWYIYTNGILLSHKNL